MDPAHDDTGLRPLSFVTDGVRARAADAILDRRPHDAATELTLLASLAPRDLPVWLQLGHQRVLAGQPAAAAEAYLVAAGIYARRGHGRRALTVARRALQLHVAACTATRLEPIARSLGAGAASLVEQAARGHLLAGRPDSARRLLAMLLEVDPASIDRRWQLAEVQLAQGAWMDAVEQLHLVADGLRMHGRISELVHVAEMALQYGGPDAALLRELAAIYRRTGQRALAQAKLEQLHRFDPDDRDALEGLARAAAEVGKIEGALQHLEQLVLHVLRSADRAQVRAVLARSERWSGDPTFSSGVESLRVRALCPAPVRRVPPPPPRRSTRSGPPMTLVSGEISAPIELC
jgi:tetratricopeptide (TPR) repeat protein